MSVEACDLSCWYPDYAKWTFPTIFIPLPSAMVELLVSDGVQLPTHEPDCPFAPFASTLQALDDARVQHGGRCFLKLNWSAPRDALWMLGTLQCTSLEDILLLLQSSDFLMHDLQQTPRPIVALRAWQTIPVTMEFRCFIQNHTLLALAPRATHPIPFHTRDRASLLADTLSFLSSLPLLHPDIVVDIVLLPEPKIVDFNVFGPVTDGLVYSWSHLPPHGLALRATSPEHAQQLLQDHPDCFRVVAPGVQPHPYSNFRVPVDFLEQGLHTPEGMAAFLTQHETRQEN